MRITFSSRCDIFFVVRFYFYYEQQIKRELQGIHICGGRSNERLKSKTNGSMSHMHCVPQWGTGTPKDRDEVNRFDVVVSSNDSLSLS